MTKTVQALLSLLFLAGVQVAAAGSTVIVSSTVSTATLGQPVTITTTVTPTSATGAVTFYDGTTLLGTRPVSSGTASFTTNLLPFGAHSLKSYYGGDGSNAAATSAAIALTVNAQPEAGFQFRTSYFADVFPLAVTAGDFNGDGKADLLVVDSSAGNVKVFLGNGDGTFQAGVTYPVGTSPYGVSTGDFNGDGKTDVAVANSTSNNVSILLGKGDGTFSAAVNYNAGSGPRAIAVGDFNGDGKPDLAAANFGSNTVSVLIGKGDGTFLSAASYNVGQQPQSLVVADFNGDGRADLAVANSGVLGGGGNISILLGVGNGAFQSAVNFPAGGNPLHIATADLNADGNADVIATFVGGGGVAVLLGGGDGTLQAASSYAATGGTSVGVGDFNGDGIPDVAAGTQILLGTGKGAFQAGVFFSSGVDTGGYSDAAVVADFNGDGRPDLAICDGISTNLEIWLGIQPGTATALASTPSPATYGQAIQLTATVTAAGNTFAPPVPTGKVTFYDGATILGTTAVASGRAVLSTKNLPPGTHSLTAVYSGDSYYASSRSTPVPQSVGALPENGFTPVTNYSVGPSPAAIVAGDFNGDGKIDLAVANSSLINGTVGNSVSILLGNGDGTFQAAVNYPAGSTPFSLATGDFNGDGKTDLVAADIGSNSIAILLGNGDGTFQPLVSYSAGVKTASVAVGDFNGDGKADIVASNFGDNTVSVLLGNGDGTFAKAVSYAAGTGPYFVAIGDFNSDGKADLAVTDSTGGGVAILPGNGDGTFQDAVIYAAGPNPDYVAVGDFNGDGKPDLAVANGNGVGVLIGNGDGTFQTQVNYAAGMTTDFVATGDFNGDGKLDLAFVASPNVVGIMFGKGDGTFQAAVDYTAGGGADGPAVVGDFNGDGRSDIAVVSNFSNLASVFLGVAPAATTTTLTVSANPSAYGAPVTLTATVLPKTANGNVTFFDGTTILGTGTLAAGQASLTTSLLASSARSLTGFYNGNTSGLPSKSSVVKQTVNQSPQSGFNSPVQYSGLNMPESVAIGDFNGDGAPDLAIANFFGNNVSVLQNNGHGIYGSAVNFPAGYGPTSIATGDFNGDGKTDLAVSDYNGNTVSVLLGNGDCTFAAPVVLTAGSEPGAIAVGDFNGDGKADLAVATVSGLSVYLGNGDGSFQAALSFPSVSSASALVVGDFNGDGIADLAVANGNPTYLGSSNSVSVMLGKGNGTFQAAASYTVGFIPKGIAVGDFNGDGIPDLVTANSFDNTVSVLLGTGKGAFATAVTYAVGASPSSVAVGDFDGDGKQDLFVTNANTTNAANGNTVSILRGSGTGTFLAPVNISAPGNPLAVAVADVNNDGLADMVVVTTNLVAVFRGFAPPGATSTTVSLATSPNPAVYGQNVTLTGKVAAAAATGTLTFYDGVAVLGTQAVSAGSATLTTGLLSSGTHSIKVKYNGDGVYAAAVSSTLTQTVTPVPTNGLGSAVSSSSTVPSGVMVAGDFNGDGKLDLAIGNSSGVTIVLGSGGGKFLAPVSYPIAGGATAITTGDFNGDGKADIVAIGTSIAVLAGNGDGTFQLPINSLGGGGTSVFAGDFNGDGYQDIAVGGLQIFLGNGDGTFGPGVTYSPPNNAQADAVAMGDFNGDGNADFAVANVDMNSNDNVTVFLGNGDGTFTSASSSYVLGTASQTTSGPVPRSLAVGDFNGDGLPDLAVTTQNFTTSGYLNQLVILAGKGNGTFQRIANYSVTGTPGAMVVADLNGDGIPDLAVSCSNVGNYSPTNRLFIYYGSRNGTLQTPVSYVMPDGASVAFADLNGDGRPDLISTNSDTSTVNVYFGLAPSAVSLVSSVNPLVHGKSTTLTATVSPSGATGSVSFYTNVTLLGSGAVTAGKASLTTVLLPAGIQSLRAVYSGDSVYSSAGSGAVAQSVTSTPQNGVTTVGTFATGAGPQGMAQGDFNGDGIPDIVTVNISGTTSSVSLLLGNGDGTFQSPVNYACGYDPIAIAVGDFNGDGKLDFVAVGGSFNVFLGNGDGTFKATLGQSATYYYAVAVADLNRDGRLDLVVTAPSYVGILLGNGDGTFQSANNTSYGAGSYPTSIVVTDLNGDGKPDLVVGNGSDDTFYVYLGNGDGTLRVTANYATGGATLGMASGDFDGDGNQDLAVGIDFNNVSYIKVFPGTGTGAFGSPTTYASARYPQSIVSADFNGDGFSDLVAGDAFAGNIGMYYNKGDGTFEAPVNYSAGAATGPLAVLTADFNGDGRADIAALGYTSVLALLGIPPGPDLTIAKSHTGTFSINQGGFTYSLLVSNTGNASSSGTVTVADILPTGLTATAVSGSGWTCVTATATCTRGEALAAGASYPAITLTVTVAANAPASLTNSASVSGGGDVNLLNNVASDPTVISPVGQTPQTISFTNPGNQTGPAPVTLAATASSGLGITYTSSTPLVCSVSGSTVTVIAVGTCTITVSQAGNPTYAAAASVTQSFKFLSTGLGATVVLGSSASPARFGQAVTFTATLTPAAATGRVTFYDGSIVLGSALLVSGKATFTTSLLAFGPRHIQAFYLGGLSYAPVRSPLLTQVVNTASQNGFHSAVSYATGSLPLSVATADFNGDGRLDVAVANRMDNSLSILPGNGDGTFKPGIALSTSQSPDSIVVADFNGDGIPDLAYAAYSTTASSMNVLMGNGDGTFQPAVSYPSNTYSTFLAVGDFNRDGYADLVVLNNSSSIGLFLGNGDGTFRTGVAYGIGFGVASVAIGDFNGDGNADFALAGSGVVSTFMGNGDGTFSFPVTNYTIGNIVSMVAAADLNGDGILDLAVTSYAGSSTPGVLSILLGNANGTFQAPVTYSVGTLPQSVVVGDFNGDGKADLVVVNNGDNNVSLLLGDGTGAFHAAANYSVGNLPQAAIAADFNGDGGTDLVIANSGSNSVSVLLGETLPAQAITFGAIANVTYGVAPFTLAATASSGLTVTFASNTSGVCTVSGNTVTIIAAGTCSITASQTGNSSFGAAPLVTNTFVVNASPQTITFTQPSDSIFGALLGPALVASASSGLSVTFTSNTPAVCTVYAGYTIATVLATGSCSITATQAGNSTYQAATPVTLSFNIAKGTQNINFPLPSGFGSGATFTTAPVTLQASTYTGLAVVYTSSTPGVCTVSGNQLTMVSVGTCTIVASQPGNSNYQAATPVTQSFAVSQGTQTITFTAPAAVTLPAAAFTLAATATSGLPVAFASTTATICTVTNSTTLNPLSAGTCSITASQPGNANYLAATPVTQSFTINPASTGGGGNSGGGGGGGGGSTGGGGGNPLTVSPTSVTIGAAVGGSPASQQITLSYATFTQGAPSYSSNFNTNQGRGWLSVSPASGTMTQASYAGFLYTYTATITIAVDPTGIPAGSAYTGTVNFNSSGGIASLGVTMNVSSQPAKFSVAPQSLAFSYQVGSATTPGAQSFSVFSVPSGAAFTVAASSTGSWLSATAAVASPTTPGPVSVAVNTSGLAAGTYSGSVAVTSGSSTISVPVTLNVLPVVPAAFSVSPGVEALTAAQGAGAVSGQITVSNVGGGTLQFTSQASSAGWLKITGSGGGSATRGSPATVSFTANPGSLAAGVYNGKIVVSDVNSPAQSSATVVLTITATGAQLQLSDSGLTLTAVTGGGVPQAQTTVVSNTGGGTLNWATQTSTASGGNWLTVTPASGSVGGGQPGTKVSISANSTVLAGLAAGQYYGIVNFTASGAANSPQSVSVVLNVLSAQSNPGVSVSTGGLVLIGAAGSATPAQQNVGLYNATSAAVSYTTSVLTQNGASWLSATPASGNVNAGANTLQIAANLSALSAGVQTGTVSLGFGDGSTQTIQVLAIATGSAAGAASVKAHTMSTAVACAGGKAGYLIPIFQQPLGQSQQQVAAATIVRAQVVDDCGNSVTAASGGSVQVSFSNGDSGINLNDTGSGLWEATWIPANPGGSVTLQAAATANGLTVNSALSSLSTVSVSVLAATATSAPQATGIANAASAGQAIPGVVAPGSYVAIYGTGLAGSGSPSATSLPLPTTLNGTQLLLGGVPMPLLYASAGQVNALVPEGIAPNGTYPLVIVRGTVQSVPVPLTVTELQPGAYTVDTSGSGAGIVTNALTGQLITASNPAHAGDYLVVYATGLGALVGPNGETEPGDGAVAPSTIIYSTTAKVTATLGGANLPVLFSGLTPTFAGLYQVNVQVPTGVTAGSGVPIVLTATDPVTGATATGNAVMVSVQ